MLAHCLKQPTRTRGLTTALQRGPSRLSPSANRTDPRPYSVLLPVGFTMPVPLPEPRCALTAPFHPYPARRAGRFCLCGTFPGVAPAGRYPAPHVKGARTFLPGNLSVVAGAAVRPTDEKRLWAIVRALSRVAETQLRAESETAEAEGLVSSRQMRRGTDGLKGVGRDRCVADRTLARRAKVVKGAEKNGPPMPGATTQRHTPLTGKGAQSSRTPAIAQLQGQFLKCSRCGMNPDNDCVGFRKLPGACRIWRILDTRRTKCPGVDVSVSVSSCYRLLVGRVFDLCGLAGRLRAAAMGKRGVVECRQFQ